MKTKRIPFDIEKAKNGAKIVTRSGLSAKRVDVDVNNGHPVLCLVTWKDGIETPILYSIDGRYYPDQIDDKDLFIEENEVEETDDYDPYKATVESIADMVERYSELQSIEELKDFYNNVRVKCQDAFDYGRVEMINLNEEPDDNKQKFKVGDWVVSKDGKVNQVKTVSDDGYAYTLDDETYFSGSWKDTYHPWTIQDAKNGDVIACNSSIMLFKEIDDLNNIKGHCTYHFTDTPMFFVDSVSTRDVFHPATKEQRDILFKKMKEEGYEWDSDKKELKIEKVKTRRMTNQELSWWLREHLEERREYTYSCNNKQLGTCYCSLSYEISEADTECDDRIFIRRNGGEWIEPLIEEMED